MKGYNMKNLTIVNHPLIQHHLTELRNEKTPTPAFRACVAAMGSLMAFEATRDMVTETVDVQTPVCKTSGQRLAERIALVPILRAGLGMVEPALVLMPDAEVWHLGLYRDETTHQPVQYYNKFEGTTPPDYALILDPMLATGGSAEAAAQALKDWGVKKIKLLALIAAPEGVKLLNEKVPELEIFCCSLDEKLNENAYIVPGLGDAGDRIFNVKA